MARQRPGTIHLFQFRGIDVFLDWSWFLVAFVLISLRRGAYSSIGWNIAEYVALFAIVLLHEFGHAFACRQVGGISNEIVLWPLGGIAFARPPPCVGAELWTIAAGPLVNVALFPVLMLVADQFDPRTDLGKCLYMVWWINRGLLLFNLLPIFPLDGGQILRALLWFRLGRIRSLEIAAKFGLAGLGLLVLWRLVWSPDDWGWTLFLAFFLGQQAWAAYRHAKQLGAVARMPRHVEYACPACRESPPGGPIWVCSNCHHGFDMFSTRAVCPHCNTVHPRTTCAFCGSAHPIEQWEKTPRRSDRESPVIDI